MERYVGWGCICYHPYLVSMLFADLLSLHLVTCFLFLCIINNTFMPNEQSTVMCIDWRGSRWTDNQCVESSQHVKWYCFNKEELRDLLSGTAPMCLPFVYLMSSHMTKSSRPSPSIFAYPKRSNTGGGNSLGMRLQDNEDMHADEQTSSLLKIYTHCICTHHHKNGSFW